MPVSRAAALRWWPPRCAASRVARRPPRRRSRRSSRTACARWTKVRTYVTQSGATLEQIVGAVKKVTDIVAEIAAASREQSAGIEQVNKAVMQLDELTQQNAALVEQASAASQNDGGAGPRTERFDAAFPCERSACRTQPTAAPDGSARKYCADQRAAQGRPPVDLASKIRDGCGARRSRKTVAPPTIQSGMSFDLADARSQDRSAGLLQCNRDGVHNFGPCLPIQSGMVWP